MNIYDCNDTMKMLGNQVSPMWFNEKVRKDVQDIFDAYEKHAKILFTSDTLSMMSNIFNLGVIYGKRDLRSKKGGGRYYNLLGAYTHKALQQVSNSRVKSLD